MDGLDDVIIGAYKLSTDKGASYIFYVNSSNQTGTANEANANANFNGIYLEYTGASLSLNDLNGDGKPDLIIGGTGNSYPCNDKSNVAIFYSKANNFTSQPISSAILYLIEQ